jgi:hypothetical protein
MKTGKWILTIWLAASAWAQTSTPKPQAATQSAAKPNGVQTVSLTAATSPKPATAADSMKAASPAARNTKVQPAKSPAPSAAASSAASAPARRGRRRTVAQRPSATGTVAPVAAEKPERKGRRDPFVSPIMERSRVAASCTGAGKRCLYIGDISLRGVVQASNGVIAVAMSGAHTYFLREHDPLADGEVVRITRDAMTLRQRSFDVLGRPLVREVTRKVGAPAV